MAGRRIYVNPDTAGINIYHYNRLGFNIIKGPRQKHPMGNT